MNPDTLTLAFWATALIAAWMQSLTGFALGLVLMGVTGLFGLMPIPQAAIVTSILVVVNAAMILGRGWRDIDRPALALTLAGSMPAMLAGYALLHWLAGQALWALQLLLGLLIAGSALQLAARPRARAERSAPWSFVATGAVGGVMGGLFATAGPPIIWQLYRQPMAMAAVRVTLVAAFAANQILRLGLAAATDGIPAATLVAALGAVPAVLIGTTVARRWPPPLSPGALRRLAFGLLFLSGLSLIVAGLSRIG